jgi:disulfide bond formation protein DsbB
MHGGAVVALLASLGQSPHGPRLAPHVWWPLGSCSAGIGFSARAWVAAYATPSAPYHESVCATSDQGPRPMTFLWATVGFVAAGFLACAVGACASVAVLTAHAPPSQRAQQGAAPDA